jgi:hypothetical protein
VETFVITGSGPNVTRLKALHLVAVKAECALDRYIRVAVIV